MTSPKGAIRLKPARPNAGNEVYYHTQLMDLINDMNKSVDYWLTAEYRANTPAMAQDATPATALRAAMRKLGRRWVSRFDKVADDLATRFTDRTQKTADMSMNKALKDAGFAIKFQQTEAMQDAVSSVIGENVALIKSIPQKYLTDVEGAVMRSVQAGRNLKELQNELTEHYGVTKRRAAFIARDQNNKATAVMTKARRLSIGITQAEWVHSGGGHKPRPSHVKAGADKLRYDVTKGALIDGEYIMPGELPNCRCVSRAIIPGFDE